MSKILKAKYPKKCVGCEMCVMESQRQLKKVGLEGSLIRIFRNKAKEDFIEFSIELDPRINQLDIKAIKDICPNGVYEIEDESES